MSLEQDLKNAFEQHARDAQPDGESWATVERKIRRAHKQRVALLSTVTVAVVVAAAVLIPRIGTKPESRGFTNPSVTPTATSAPTPSVTPTPIESPSAGPAIPDGWQRRVGVQSAFQLAIPADWKGGWFEGTWDFEPKGQPSVAEGGDLFAVTVTVQAGAYDQAASGRHASKTTVNGMRALTWTTGTDHLWYAVEWFACPGYTSECSSNFETRTLVVHLFASTRALWDQYLSTGKEIVTTIAHYDGSTPVHGTIAKGIAVDDFTKVLVRFLDARVEGIGAEDSMSAKAQDQYGSGGALDLYETGIPARPWLGYAITKSESGPQQNVVTFTVDMTFSEGAYVEESIQLKQNSPGTAPFVDSATYESVTQQ
ncbi:MAG: hypothetical protein ACXVQY_05600 [Actinomycetota bacterium]